jgi:hypothetical protein
MGETENGTVNVHREQNTTGAERAIVRTFKTCYKS